MAIFANQSAIRFSQTPVDIVARRPIPNGAILVYDANKGVFVTSGNTSSRPFIEDATSTGGSNSYSIFKEKSGTELVFKEIEAGPGIEIDETQNTLTISSSMLDTSPVSDSDYSIVIDSNNDETNAKFKLLTGIASPINPLVFNPQTIVLQNQDVWADNDLTRGFIQSTGSNNFLNNFEFGQFLEISNSQDTNNSGTNDIDGDFVIDEVVSSGPNEPNFPGNNHTIYIEQTFSNINTLPNFYNQIDLIAWDLNAPDTTTIESSITDFGPNGKNLLPGMEIQITGSKNSDFDGTYKINNVLSLSSATGIKSIIELNSNTPLPQTGFIKDYTPSSPRLQITVIEYVGDTGFYVNKNGDIHGNNLVLTGDVEAVNADFVNEVFADKFISNSIETGNLTVTIDLQTQELQVNDSITTDTLIASGSIKTNHNASSGNDVPNLDWIENNVVEKTSSTGAAILPKGTTAERPHPAVDGMIRYNTDTNTIEACIAGGWVNLF